MATFKRPRSQLGERSNLPVQFTGFVGRGSEVAAVKELLSRARLVTLTGAGGVGKTRLALQAASQLLREYEHGVWFIELAPLGSEELVASAIADSMGADDDPQASPLERAARMLLPGRQLLVLDNCEHVVVAAADVCRLLLTKCTGLRVLATSREPLGVADERVWLTPSLGLPDPGVSTADAMATVESVQLLCDRARLVAPNFQLSAANAVDVGAICQRLDGLPLALELAAAWVTVLSPSQIATRLDDTLRLLTAGGSDRVPRHRTMRAALDWSHQLLNPKQGEAFARLSVFRGGFTVEGAEVVLEGLPYNDGTPLDLLASLIARSLVVADTSHDEARYHLLEPVRQYAAELLRMRSEEGATRRRHLRYLVEVAEAAEEPLVSGAGQAIWLARLDAELPNVRAALAWGFEHDEEPAARLATALRGYCFLRNLQREGLGWARRSVATGGRSRARALLMAGQLASLTGDAAGASDYLAQASELMSDPGLQPDKVFLLQAQGGVAMATGDLNAARLRFEEAVQLARELNDEARTMHAQLSLAIPTGLQGEQVRACELIREAVGVAMRSGNQWVAAAGLSNLAYFAIEMGDLTTASEAIREGLDLWRSLGDDALLAYFVEEAGIVAIQQGSAGPGLRLLAAARATLERLRIREDPDEGARRRRWTDVARQREGSEAEAAWVGGRDLPIHAAAVEARGIVADGGSTFAALAPLSHREDEVAALAVEGEGGNAFMREGEFWSLIYDGVVARLKDSKGLRDIARLLATPGREVAAVDLMSGELVGKVKGVARLGEIGLGVEGDVGEALDSEARAQYRARLSDLEEEIAEADVANDPERASRARVEREFLLAELGAAVGLAGRARHALDPAERARKAATWRVRDAINRIERAHHALGRHLRLSVRTGSFCVYDPSEAIAWRL